MHNPDDKHPTRPGFEPSTSEFQATIGANEPSAGALIDQVCSILGHVPTQ